MEALSISCNSLHKGKTPFCQTKNPCPHDYLEEVKIISLIVLWPFRMALFPKLWNARRLRLGNPSWKYAHEFAAMGSPEFDCRRFGPAFAEAASRRQVQSSLREPCLRAWFCFCRYLNLSIGSDSRVVKWLATGPVWFLGETLWRHISLVDSQDRTPFLPLLQLRGSGHDSHQRPAMQGPAGVRRGPR